MTRTLLLALAALVAVLLLAPAAEASYTLETAFGSIGANQGQTQNAGFLATAGDGTLYVADTGNNRIEHLTADGAPLNETAAGIFNGPQGVAVGLDGTVYVTDTGNNRVVHFSADLQAQLGAVGGQAGSLDGQFNGPTGIAVGPDGSVFVGDSGNHRVQRFQADLTQLSSVAMAANSVIQGLAVDQTTGVVYVVDSANEQVTRFNSASDAITFTRIDAFGSPGSGNGQFQNPRGIAATAAGVYVADLSQNRVQKFTPGGALDDTGTLDATTDPAFSGPWGIAYSTAGQMFVAQPGTGRIARYRETSSGAGGTGFDPNLATPQTGGSAQAKPVSGTVRIKRPGSPGFETLTAGASIPIGSIIDVTKGTIALTTTSGPNGFQTATFFAGVFQLLQDKRRHPVTEARLYGGNFKRACGRAGAGSLGATASAKKKVVRHLWGSGKGSFRTRGRYSSAAIRGTEWLTQDRCDGTNVRVKQGVVTVRDLVRKINVLVRAPRSYFAAAKPPKKRR